MSNSNKQTCIHEWKHISVYCKQILNVFDNNTIFVCERLCFLKQLKTLTNELVK
jgi:hypothetical protein